ncbi:MAG: DUF167 domain-containing protein [Betaproteobacteria bacterium]
MSALKVLSIKVKPGARTSMFAQTPDGGWLAQIRAQPVDGKANAELIVLVARHFGCGKSAVSIISGVSSRTKRVSVELADAVAPKARAPRRAPSQ